MVNDITTAGFILADDHGLTTDGLDHEAGDGGGNVSISGGVLRTTGLLAGGSLSLTDVETDETNLFSNGGDIALNNATITGSLVSGDQTIAMFSDGRIDVTDTSVTGVVDLNSTGGQSLTRVSVPGEASLYSTGTGPSGEFQVEDLSIGGQLMLNAGGGSVTQTGGFLTVGGIAVIYSAGNVLFGQPDNDFQSQLALLTGGNAEITDIDDLDFGLSDSTVFFGTSLGDFAETLIGNGRLTSTNNVAGVIGGSWVIEAADAIAIEGTLDSTAGGAGNLTITPNATGAITEELRFGDRIGAAQALGGVQINRANGVTFGELANGAAILDQNTQQDVFFAQDLVLRDVAGTVITPRGAVTDLEFNLNLFYFGLNIEGVLDYNGNPNIQLLDLTGAIAGQRSQSAGLLPTGPRGPQFVFNNCEIGSISDCSNEPPTIELPQIDLSVPNIFAVDFESLGDVYVNFGNEELWSTRQTCSKATRTRRASNDATYPGDRAARRRPVRCRLYGRRSGRRGPHEQRAVPPGCKAFAGCQARRVLVGLLGGGARVQPDNPALQ